MGNSDHRRAATTWQSSAHKMIDMLKCLQAHEELHMDIADPLHGAVRHDAINIISSIVHSG
jgi:hypothetical protein